MDILKCPKCSCYTDNNPCDCCGYEGKDTEFKAKRYKLRVSISIKVIAFNEKDLKRELEDFQLDYLNRYNYKIIEKEVEKKDEF
jgi:hypothetical protein